MRKSVRRCLLAAMDAVSLAPSPAVVTAGSCASHAAHVEADILAKHVSAILHGMSAEDRVVVTFNVMAGRLRERGISEDAMKAQKKEIKALVVSELEALQEEEDAGNQAPAKLDSKTPVPTLCSMRKPRDSL